MGGLFAVGLSFYMFMSSRISDSAISQQKQEDRISSIERYQSSYSQDHDAIVSLKTSLIQVQKSLASQHAEEMEAINNVSQMIIRHIEGSGISGSDKSLTNPRIMVQVPDTGRQGSSTASSGVEAN
jgi:hypothetical protein